MDIDPLNIQKIEKEATLQTLKLDIEILVDAFDRMQAQIDNIAANARPNTSDISEITGLTTALNGKSGLAHNHTHFDVVGLDKSLKEIEKRLDKLELPSADN